MHLLRNRKAQASIEGVALFALVVGAVLIGHNLLSRGLQGSFKESADKLGPAYSVNETAIETVRAMNTDNIITEEVATTSAIADYVIGGTVVGVLDDNIYSLNTRSGGESTNTIKTQTDAVINHTVRSDEFAITDYEPFADPF